jgi:NADH:ubiquinone oxidoreductase subunit 6 (subunit J)
MNGIFNPIVFYPATVIMILFAVLTISFKNIFYSLLSAIIVFFIAGMFFYVLGSEYNAVIQIAIYGIAIPIILALAIMFTDLKKENKTEKKDSNLKYIILLSGGIFVLALIYLVLTSLVINPTGFNIAEINNTTQVQVMNAFSRGIFVNYVLAFELISLILTITIAGLIIFNNKEGK